VFEERFNGFLEHSGRRLERQNADHDPLGRSSGRG
jgi:hypothetical protein